MEFTDEQVMTVIQVTAALASTNDVAGLSNLPPADRALAMAFAVDLPKKQQQALFLAAGDPTDTGRQEDIGRRLGIPDPEAFLAEARQAMIAAAKKRLDGSDQAPAKKLSTPVAMNTLRKLLKRRWPNQKFYISRHKRKRRVVYVQWQDGPTKNSVGPLASIEGWGHDTTIRKLYRVVHWLADDNIATARIEGTAADGGVVPNVSFPRPWPEAELVHFDVEIVVVERTFSPTFARQVLDEVQEQTGWAQQELKEMAWKLPNGKEIGQQARIVDSPDTAPGTNEKLSDLYWQHLYTRAG